MKSRIFTLILIKYLLIVSKYITSPKINAKNMYSRSSPLLNVNIENNKIKPVRSQNKMSSM